MGDGADKLVDALRDQQKLVLFTALALALFAVAPRENQLLRDGKTELDAFRDPKSALDKVRAEAAAPKWLESTAGPRPLEDAERDALGYRVPEELGGLVAAKEGQLHRCEPQHSEAAWNAIQAAKPPGVTVLGSKWKVRPVYDDAATRAAERALTLAWEAREAQVRADGAIQFANSERTKADELKKHPVPSDTTTTAHGSRPIVTANSAPQELASKKRTAADRARDAERVAESAESERDKANSSLRNALAALRRAVDAQTAGPREPQFIVVELALGTDAATPTDRLDVPVACKLESVLAAAKTPVLPQLRATSVWSSLREFSVPNAKLTLEETLSKSGETVELVGLKIPGESVAVVGPLALLAVTLWYAWLIGRARARPEVRELEDFLPDVPAPTNWIAPVFLASVVVLTSTLFGLREWRTASSYAWLVAGPIVAAFVALGFAFSKAKKSGG